MSSREPECQRWDIGRDRYGRRVTLTKTGHDWKIEIEPCNQRDDGERIYSLSRELLIEAGEIAKGR